MAADSLLRVAVSAGELIDKITILEIKAQRIDDPHQREHVRRELAHLEAVRDQALPPSPTLAGLADALRAVNARLWDVEDALRQCEADQDFGPRFVELARSVYRLNDRRFALKQQINAHTGSQIQEQKSYRGSRPVDGPGNAAE